MNAFCPNLSDKKIKQEFDELINIFGEDQAYLLWDRTNGNGMELAPNGAASKLFLNLLKHYDGDRTKAIKAKAKTLTNEFFNWFGDWTHLNEALVKYYGPTMGKTTASKTNKNLVDFDDIARESIKKLADNKGKTVREIKIECGKEYRDLLLNIIREWKKDSSNKGKTLVVSNAVLSTEDIFDNEASIPSKELFVKRLMQRGESDRLSAEQYYDDLLKRNPNLKIDDRFISEIEKEVSKIVDENGEPLIVYHGSDYELDATKQGDWSKNALPYATYFAPYKYTGGNLNYYYGAFLNIKNPIYEHYDLTEDAIQDEDVFNKLIKEKGFDGVITGNDGISKAIDAKEIVVINPNQVKSATDNKGNFSTTNDNIYHNISLDYAKQRYEELLKFVKNNKSYKKGWLADFNKKHGTNFGFNKETKLIVSKSPTLYGIPLTNDNVKEVQPREFIDRALLLEYLGRKFNLKFRELDSNTYNKYFGKFSNCSVKKDTVFIRRGDLNKLTNELIIEEFLHPVIHHLYSNNDEVSLKLLKEAKSKFPKLCKLISAVYKNRGLDVINEEIITQVLSKYLNKEISDNGTDVRNLKYYIHQFIQKIIDSCKDLFGEFDVNNYIASGKDIRDVFSFKNLAELINSKEITFDDKLDIKEYRNNLNSNPGSITDILDNREYEDIKASLAREGISDDGYAMRTAIHKSRNEYMDSEESKFIEEFIDKLKVKPNGFFKKVLHFFKSKWNNGRIKDPSNKDKKNVRDRAKKEFDETIYHNTILSIIDILESIGSMSHITEMTKLALYIQQLYDNLDRYAINNILSFVDISANNVQLVFNNVQDVYNVLKVLEDLNSDIYTEGIQLFKSKQDIAKYIINNDLSALSQDLKDYICQFKHKVQSWMDLNINDKGALHDLRTMFFELDSSLRCSNENAYNDIKSGLESRLVSIQRRSIVNNLNYRNVIYNIKSRISSLKQMNMYDVSDMYKVYLGFLEHAEVELNQAIDYFNNCILTNKVVTPETLMYLKKDVLGYYDYIIENYIKELSKEEGLSDSQIKDIKEFFKNSIEQKLNEANDLYRQANTIFVENTIDKYVENNVNLGDNAAYKRMVKNAILNKINNGSLPGVEMIFGDANSSKSPIVRIIANMLNNDEREVHRRTYERGKHLMKLYSDSESFLKNLLHPDNYMKNFVELDDEGRPTGNFLREINYGLFEKNKKKFEKGLRKEFGLSSDEKSNTIFHWDNPKTESIYNQYMDRLDDWLENNCYRRYTSSYYKTRRRYLNYKVRQVLDPINEQINLLQEKCTITDINGERYVFINKLTLNERLRLQDLLKQKQEISNPYSIEYDSNGINITSLHKKTGEELEIAEAIQLWNKIRSKHIVRNSNRDKYDRALNSIKDPNEKAIFEDANLKKMISPEFYDLLSKCSTATQTEKYLQISAKRSKLIASVKEDGMYHPNLLRLNDQAWDELNELERELEANKTQGSKGSVDFDSIATKELILITDPENQHSKITYLDYFKRMYQRMMMTDPNAMNDFYNRFYIKVYDKKCKRDILRPLNVFYETKPINTKYILKLTVGPYIEYNKFSDWINPQYNENSKEKYLPRIDMYYNDNYDKIMSNGKAKAFYDDLIKMMKESISLLNDNVDFSEYKMPLITDNGLSLLSRNIMSLNFSNIPKSMVQYFTLTEKDDDFNENRALRPDKTLVESIPLRFINDLDDKSLVSCDILHTVCLFYQMALNYHLKSKTVPIAESIIEELGKDVSTDQYQRVKTLVEMYGYGRMLKGIGNVDLKMSKWEKFWTKLINNHKKLAQLALLSGNIASAVKGAISAQWQVFWGGVIGKYYSVDDLLYGYEKVITGFPNALRDLGSQKTHNLLQALMLKDGAARSISDIFKDKHLNVLRRLLSFFRMGLFTIGDYTSNALITASVYHATRLVEDPLYKGVYKFMTKTQIIDAYKKSGKSVNEAKRAFKRSRGNHLMNMYELDSDGKAVLKKEVKVTINNKEFNINPIDYIRPNGKTNIEDRIAGTIESRASIANGVTAEHGKGAIYQNTYAKLVMVMRGFLISQGFDRLKTGNDFEDLYYDKGNLRSIKTLNDYKGQYNFETGEVERGTLLSTKDLFTSFSNMLDILRDFSMSVPLLKKIIKDKQKRGNLTREDIMGVKLTLGDLIGAGCFLSLSAFVFIPATRRYPESWFLALMRMVTAGVGIETSTMLNPNTGLDLLTSVTTVKSWIDDILSIGGMFKSLLSDPSKLEDPVTNGAYKNKPRWFRYLMKSVLKPTGLTGYYESLSPVLPGVDIKESQYSVDQEQRFNNIKNRPWFDSMENFGDNLYDLYKISATPYGQDSKYDYYQKNVSPATWLPKRKDDSEESNSNKSKSSRSGRKTSSSSRSSR